MGGRGSSGGGSTAGRAPRLPDLTGSEKQIKWANDIRDRAFNTLREMEQEKPPMRYDYTVPGGSLTIPAYSKSDIEAVRQQIIKLAQSDGAKSASAWINMRNRFTKDALQKIAESYAISKGSRVESTKRNEEARKKWWR